MKGDLCDRPARYTRPSDDSSSGLFGDGIILNPGNDDNFGSFDDGSTFEITEFNRFFDTFESSNNKDICPTTSVGIASELPALMDDSSRSWWTSSSCLSSDGGFVESCGGFLGSTCRRIGNWLFGAGEGSALDMSCKLLGLKIDENEQLDLIVGSEQQCCNLELMMYLPLFLDCIPSSSSD